MTSRQEWGLTLRPGPDGLSESRSNTGVRRDMFCSVSDVFLFHHQQGMPDPCGADLYCRKVFGNLSLDVRAAQGKTIQGKAEGARAFWPGPRVS